MFKTIKIGQFSRVLKKATQSIFSTKKSINIKATPTSTNSGIRGTQTLSLLDLTGAPKEYKPSLDSFNQKIPKPPATRAYWK